MRSVLPSFLTSFHTEKLEKMFTNLDVDGNGTIDFHEFKAGVKREPLLVQAFLAPVQQGSLAAAPAAQRQVTALGGGKAVATARPEESPTADLKSFTAPPNEELSQRPQLGEEGEQRGVVENTAPASKEIGHCVDKKGSVEVKRAVSELPGDV